MLGPFGLFQTKVDFLLQSTLAKQHFVFLSEMVPKGPNGPIKNSKIFPFQTLLDHFGILSSLPCLAIFAPKGPLHMNFVVLCGVFVSSLMPCKYTIHIPVYSQYIPMIIYYVQSCIAVSKITGDGAVDGLHNLT